jgi:integrase
MRPSEEIALEVADCDLTQGKVMVSKARVMRHDKDRAKTGEDRLVELCPRALEVLKRQLALRGETETRRSDCPKCHTRKSPLAPRIWHWLALDSVGRQVSRGFRKEIHGGREGLEPSIPALCAVRQPANL